MAACALAVMGFVACSKDDNATVNNEVKVNFTVADKPSFDDTRAAKSAWADGDQIMVVFNATGSLDSKFNTNNILTLTYSSGVWTSSDVSSFISDLGASGNYKAFHYRGNVGFTTVDGTTFFNNYKGGDFLQCKGGYTISGNELTLTDDIEMGFFDANVCQISVKGLDQSKQWKMTVAYNNQWETASANNQYNMYYYFGENSVYFEDNTVAKIVDNDTQFQSWGVNNSNGDVAFWIYCITNPSTHIMFHIESDDQTYRYTLKYDENVNLEGGKHYRLPEITNDYSFQGFYDWNHQKWDKKN